MAFATGSTNERKSEDFHPRFFFTFFKFNPQIIKCGGKGRARGGGKGRGGGEEKEEEESKRMSKKRKMKR